ncbi:MAG: DUF3526 domain-containing protein [Woeseiaceae bacterium]|nr:DUF3526 domain-containing protein [Woeseiaceae bacterium]
MSNFNALKHETRFMLRDRAFVVWTLVVLGFSSFAVWSGMAEVRQQRESIAFLVNADQQDRLAEFTKQSDWGSAAYYSFHLTYDPPSDFAFAAMGQRDASSWKHRLRMLALEGQIYEHDPGNPELALIGRFDFAFLSGFVLPLILIFLLHDMQASERSAGRFNLLVAAAVSGGSLWWRRAFLRSGGILVASIAPLLIAGVLSGTTFSTLIGAVALVVAYILFWTLVCLWFASWKRSAPVILASLIGVWVLLSTIMPAGSRAIIDVMVPIPTGAEILMTQREAVNDAWDLPVEDTMEPFTERHPEWTGYTHTGEGFDWGWYYAFQQVGDQTAEQLSQAYTAGRVERDRLAGLFAIAAPPALLERLLQNLAGTDMGSVLAYEGRVRDFHAELRSFHYPGLFGDAPFDPGRLADLPQFSP